MFKPVLFRMQRDLPSKMAGDDLFDYHGFAFELPDWPGVHLVAHKSLRSNYWTCTHWESGLCVHTVDMFWLTKENVPEAIDAHLKRIGRERVMAAIARWT